MTKGPHLRDIRERFWEKVVAPVDLDACWDWRGYKGKGGYARLFIGRKRIIHASRISYEINVAPIPAGLFVLHSCDNPPCTNPQHLRLGTYADNARDMVERGRGGRYDRQRGASNRRAKLTQAQADALKAEYSLGGASALSLGLKYGVSATTAFAVIHRRRYT